MQRHMGESVFIPLSSYTRFMQIMKVDRCRLIHQCSKNNKLQSIAHLIQTIIFTNNTINALSSFGNG